MKMSRKDMDGNFEQWRDWHVIVLAKAQFEYAALDFYGRVMHGVDNKILTDFAQQVNEAFETRTLYPTAPISAIPLRYMEFMEQAKLIDWLKDFWRNMKEFVDLNRSAIHARKILVDLHRGCDPVPDFFLTAVEKSFAEYFADDEIDEVVIFN
jgi:hypothetical protein